MLTASEEALSLLASQGYDAEFGARPLRRVIQQKVEDPLSDRVLGGEFLNGDSVKVEVNDDGELVLNKLSENLPEPSL